MPDGTTHRAKRFAIAAVTAAGLALAVSYGAWRRDEPAAGLQRTQAAHSALDLADAAWPGAPGGSDSPAHVGGQSDSANAYRDAGEQAGAVRLEEWAPEDLVALALGGGSASERAAAVDALAYAVSDATGTQQYADWVFVQALLDPDEQVRAQALATLKDTALDVPAADVARVAGTDASPEVRKQALELLVERTGDEANEVLRTALFDPDPAVSEHARGLISDWHLSFDGG